MLFPGDRNLQVAALILLLTFNAYLITIIVMKSPIGCGCHNVLTMFVSVKHRSIAGLVANSICAMLLMIAAISRAKLKLTDCVGVIV